MTRVRLALTAMLVAALLPAAGILTQAATSPEVFAWRHDPISLFERHVAPLRLELRGQRAVGYLESPRIEDRTAHLYTLRYALVPVQVVDDVDQPLVVADGVFAGQPIPPQLRVRRDLGDGLLLLERAP
ncbi:hypothetical protein KF840_19235 [bacterium]|nr:hypothetical protein [bacterium]